MNKAVLLCLLVIIVCWEASAQKRPPQVKSFNVFAEYYFSTDSSELTVSYKVLNKALIFLRESEKFKAKFILSVEASDSIAGLYTRDYKEVEINANTAEDTKSNSATQGVITLKLKGNENKLSVVFNDANRDRELRRMQFSLRVKETKSSKANIPADVIPFTYSDNSIYYLANYDGIIPFSNYNIGVCLRVPAEFLDYNVSFTSSDTTRMIGVNRRAKGGVSFQELKNGIQLQSNPLDSASALLFIDSVSLQFTPGFYSVKLHKDIDTVTLKENVVRLIWLESPIAVRNPELAIRLLSILGANIDSLLDLKTDTYSYGKILFSFWHKYDPTPNTTFNEVMTEFYTRVDYASENFSSLKGNDGEQSDRGKIYIKFGKPAKIENNTNTSGKIIEQWIYPDGKVFYFGEISGSGKIELLQ